MILFKLFVFLSQNIVEEFQLIEESFGGNLNLPSLFNKVLLTKLKDTKVSICTEFNKPIFMAFRLDLHVGDEFFGNGH